MQMACIHHFPTSDRLSALGMIVNAQCELCKQRYESHQMLFIDCLYSTYLWKCLLYKLELRPVAEKSLRQQFLTLRRSFANKSGAQHWLMLRQLPPHITSGQREFSVDLKVRFARWNKEANLLKLMFAFSSRDEFGIII